MLKSAAFIFSKGGTEDWKSRRSTSGSRSTLVVKTSVDFEILKIIQPNVTRKFRWEGKMKKPPIFSQKTKIETKAIFFPNKNPNWLLQVDDFTRNGSLVSTGGNMSPGVLNSVRVSSVMRHYVLNRVPGEAIRVVEVGEVKCIFLVGRKWWFFSSVSGLRHSQWIPVPAGVTNRWKIHH